MENVKPNNLLTLAKNYKRISNDYFEKFERADYDMKDVYWNASEEYENKARGVLIAYNMLTDSELMYYEI